MTTGAPGRRRLLRRAAAALAVVVVAIAAGAWFTSPPPTALDAHVRARLQGTSGRAVPLGAMAPILREAVVATEDERFYRHHGIDLIGVVRALPYDLVHLSLAQGASTITEQAGKVLYLNGNDHDPWRKLQDAALALKLESRYSKERILAAYLNSAYFGEGAFGAAAASERYFGVPPGRLGTAQGTLLAGLLQAPSAYDPVLHPAAARARQVEVLRSLVRNGFLTETEAAAVAAAPLPLRGGRALPPLRGVSFGVGPAFVWSELAFGLALAAVGAALFGASRITRLRLAHGVIAVRLASAVFLLVAAAAVVRSFRVA